MVPDREAEPAAWPLDGPSTDELLARAQRMAAIGRLAAGIAHDLNNPLASIVAFSQLLRTDPELPASLQRQADLLVAEAGRTRVLVGQLLDLVRERPPTRAATPLRPLIDGVLAAQAFGHLSHRIQAVVDVPHDLPQPSIDPERIRHLLLNLTMNATEAIVATGRPGTVRVVGEAASLQDGRLAVRVSVTDDGPGVPDSLRTSLFAPFTTSREPAAGRGLGLAVAAAIAAAHDGTIRHEPGPGGLGAIFVMELPVEAGSTAGTTADASRAESMATVEPATEPADADASARRLPRVLVLDDEPAIREFLARALRRSGYEPVQAANGEAALDEIRRDPPDAILCDHRMSPMSGTEFHAAVAAIDRSLARRFAFMSGDVMNPDLDTFASVNGIRVLAKPFTLETVSRLVVELLDEG